MDRLYKALDKIGYTKEKLVKHMEDLGLRESAINLHTWDELDSYGVRCVLDLMKSELKKATEPSFPSPEKTQQALSRNLGNENKVQLSKPIVPTMSKPENAVVTAATMTAPKPSVADIQPSDAMTAQAQIKPKLNFDKNKYMNATDKEKDAMISQLLNEIDGNPEEPDLEFGGNQDEEDFTTEGDDYGRIAENPAMMGRGTNLFDSPDAETDQDYDYPTTDEDAENDQTSR